MTSARNRLFSPSPMIQLPKIGADAGLRHHADDGADDGAGHADGQRRLGAVGERVAAAASVARPPRVSAVINDQQGDHARDRDDLEAVPRDRGGDQREPDPEHDSAGHWLEKPSVMLAAEDQRHRQRQPHRAGKQRRVAVEQHVDQRGQRQHQIPSRHQRLPGARNFRALHAHQTVLAGLQMDHPERRARNRAWPG